MASRYRGFKQVESDAKRGVYRNESELRQALVEALKEELANSTCNKYLVSEWLVPALDETLKRGRPDIRISNLVIEVEPPLSGLENGKEQLEKYMKELYEVLGGRASVLGVVTDGREAELWEKDNRGPHLLMKGSMAEVLKATIDMFCSQKIPVVRVEDLVRLFGV